MTLDSYIERLLAIREKHGGNLLCIYSKDDEGNYFEEVHYTPSVGNFKNNEFDPDSKKKKKNAVCVN